MEGKDLLDRRQEDVLPESHSQVQQPIRRELDSLDDFEHLGHDSSPLKDKQHTEDLLGLHAESPAGEVLGVIDKGVESAAKAATELTDDLARHFDRPVQEPSSLVDSKMDSNLLEMGDTFPETRQSEDKFDKFFSDLSSTKNDEKTEEHVGKEIGDFKAATQNFMDMERDFLQPAKNAGDVLDRYSDSEPEIEEAKYTRNVDKKDDLEVLQSKTDAFKDVQETEPLKPAPKEKVDDFASKIASAAPAAHVVEPPPAPAPVKKTEEIKQEIKKEPEIKKPEPPSKPETSKIEVIEAEAMFCKMGLGELMSFYAKISPHRYFPF